MNATSPTHTPQMTACSYRKEYIHYLLRYLKNTSLKPLRIVVNAGNGVAGLVIDALEPHVPFEFIKIQHEPDAAFPHGIPNPLLPEMREITAAAVREHHADLGVAWDGDFDRCFMFDEKGRFIEGYYIVGLLAEALLVQEPGSKIIHDPRLTWNTIDIVTAAGGIPIQCKTGHAFIKERMRAENALYGGELSAHHYFRDFAYCDNGNIPWLLVTTLISQSGRPLSRLVDARIQKFPASGEINRKVSNVASMIDLVAAQFASEAVDVDRTDGISISFPDWRFNLRGSNTEPMLRLNVESREDGALMREKTSDILKFIDSMKSSTQTFKPNNLHLQALP
jgi:phosphomannomutase